MKHIFLTIILLLVSFSLGGCGAAPNPEEVLQHMHVSMSQVEQVKIAGQFNLISSTGKTIFEGLSDLVIKLTGHLDLPDAGNLKYSTNLLVDGTGPEGSTRLGAEIKSFPDYNYFRITDIVIPLGLPFSLTTDNKWYKVKKSTLTDSNILGSDPNSLTDSELTEVRQLIANAHFFVPIEVLSDATVNGFRSYHISATVDDVALFEFVDQLTTITHDKIKLDKSSLNSLINNYKYDLWIIKRDYKLTKLQVSGVYKNAAYDEIAFDVELNLTNFNMSVDISLPNNDDVQDFQLDNLFGLPLINL